MPHQFPDIQGGGSLILAWQIRNKRVLVVGGGEVAAGRILNVLNADAKVTVVSPKDGLNEEVAYRIDQKQVDYIDRKFEPSDLDGADMVLTAVDDPEASTQIWKLCKERKIAANIADVPPECDFYFGSVHRDGPLQIMVSTNGNGPKLASIVRKQIAANLPPNIGAAIQKVGALRKKLRKVAPGTEPGPKRMQWMSKVCESWSLEDLVGMNEGDMEELLRYYEPGTVPSLQTLRYGEDLDEIGFDGSFGWCLKPNGQLDFSNPEAVQQLTKSLLKRDFNLEIDLPEDRLCPPVPNRLNYILWIQDLLDTTSDKYLDQYDPDRDVIGLDIGTGASCIYPLLGCRQRSRWKFGATDIDERSLQYARENVARNHLGSRVRLVTTGLDESFIPLGALGLDHIDFTMCNPPFYSSTEEMLASAKAKQRPPFSACTGAEVEMVTPGGEVAFVSRMIQESIVLRDRVEWYTSMLGKIASVSVLVEKLKSAEVGNWAVMEFVQGSKTRRWAVAWSWGDMRPRMDVARGIPGLPKHLLPFPSEFTFNATDQSLDRVAQRIDESLKTLELQWQWKPSIMTGVGFAKQNVWSRAARRQRRNQDLQDKDTVEDEEDPDEAALGFKIQAKQRKTAEHVEVVIRWLKGNDTVLFESFCGMVKRQLENR